MLRESGASSNRRRQRLNREAAAYSIARSSRTMTVSAYQFEARFGGEAGHDLISVS
jgi:hypothetical protein